MGFDIHQKRIDELQSGQDHTLEVSPEELKQATHLSYTTNLEQLADCNFFIVTVPTPIDEFKQPDLTPLVKASESIAKVLKKVMWLSMNQRFIQVQLKKSVFQF
jgi:UDP-N-acetyl-D-galactosamine dehydrogenase